ncbi:LacI family DNA-binding transcriptional regulator [Streptomyces sp. V4-01]|uniref:LacI family DNA-binding transcriptional regulator n=1 Tax=Actinacidiphila polyblastidii TaxID=3110430 RepID=A0ABU7PKI8_9ACTN|nr:LacI family DNA-binding transcriptional regulator [Streptomyces sp. V4-01]
MGWPAKSHVPVRTIAAAAGVSSARVPRVMNGGPDVTPGTRRRVLAAAGRRGAARAKRRRPCGHRASLSS